MFDEPRHVAIEVQCRELVPDRHPRGAHRTWQRGAIVDRHTSPRPWPAWPRSTGCRWWRRRPGDLHQSVAITRQSKTLKRQPL